MGVLCAGMVVQQQQYSDLVIDRCSCSGGVLAVNINNYAN